jgi:hypothetical protein
MEEKEAVGMCRRIGRRDGWGRGVRAIRGGGRRRGREEGGRRRRQRDQPVPSRDTGGETSVDVVVIAQCRAFTIATKPLEMPVCTAY